MRVNPLHAIDFYKTDHRRQYPEGTTEVYSNLTARSSKWANVMRDNFDDKIVFFGLQYFLKHFLVDSWNEHFFKKPIKSIVTSYKRRMDSSLGEDAIDIDHIIALHDLGYLPLQINALPEGSRVPIGVPILTIVNTNPKFFWLTNYIETVISAYLWKPITSATTAFEYRKILQRYAKETGADESFIDFQAHDFSFRGMSSLQDAAVSGAAHLTSFLGTDAIPGIDLLEDYYDASTHDGIIGCSVPATEHSVMCMGTEDGELETFKRLINDLYPKGIISIVSDTWDFWKVITEYVVTLKDDILAREGKVVIRPDSGDPVKIICGDIEVYDFSDLKEYDLCKCEAEIEDHIAGEVVDKASNGEYSDDECASGYFLFKGKVYKTVLSLEWGRDGPKAYFLDGFSIESTAEYTMTPENKGAVQCLWETFGGTETKEGYKTLDQHIGLIYGDSITLQRAEQILSKLKAKGFASDNIVFGVGSYTYQYATRDNFGFAMKATSGVVNGERRDIFKNPKTDDGTKKSAKGLLRVEREGETFVLYDQQSEVQEKFGALQLKFVNGELVNTTNLNQIRANIKQERK